MKRNIEEYLKTSTPQSMMRLGFWTNIKTSVWLGFIIVLGAVLGFLIGLILGRDLQGIAACIGALAGLGGAILAMFNIPAFAGKATQAKFEHENKGQPDPNAEGK